MEWQRILVAIGANLPGPDGRTARQSCEWAVARLRTLPGLRLAAVSRWYETAPIPPSGQPSFVNGVALLAGTAEPLALLHAMHGIEAEANRVRSVPNAARTLDLDLIGMDALVLDGLLRLPHPRMAQRAFVLVPLCDVAPDWRHPMLGRTAADLLRDVQDQAIGILPLPGRADATT